MLRPYVPPGRAVRP